MHTIEAIDGQQGQYRYFTANVPVGQLDHMVKFPEELGVLDEDNRMQRGLNKSRIGEMVRYLLEWPSHFYSAVTVIILPRDLDRPVSEIDEESGEGDYAFQRFSVPGRPGKSRLGHLYLTGDIVLFPGDGQHRLKSEFEAIKVDPELAGEELPVVLIPFESPEQVRQLFSDLNLNAKPISKTIGYEFETRDPLVLVTKALPQRVPLFDGRINRVTNSLPKTSKHVVTLGSLVTGSRGIVDALASMSGVPKDEYLADQATAETDLAHAWNTIIDSFAPYWDDVMHDVPGAGGLLREEYVFPHGLGWLGLAHAAAELMREYSHSWEEPFQKAVQAMDWKRVAPIWDGNAVIHDPAKGTNRVNNTGPAVRQLAAMVVHEARSLVPTP